MSDSEELLFGNITDADGGGDNKGVDGTAYPKGLKKLTMDSDSDSYNPSHSNDHIQIKKSRSNSKTKIKRDKSLKRIKDIAMNEAANTTLTVLSGEENNNKNIFVDIDPSSPIHSSNDISNKSKKSKKKRKKKGFLLNGSKSKKKDHHIISDKDSDDEDEDEYDNEMSSCRDIVVSLKENGHFLSMILTSIVIITLFTCFTGELAAVIIFVIFYLIYLCECFVNKTWKQMRMGSKSDIDGNIKLLDVMRKTAPVIDWYVECYHYETLNTPQTEAKTIIWVHGKMENGNHFQELGFDVKYFKWDWNAIEFVSNQQNQTQIAAIILPSGYQGNRIKKAIISKFKHGDDANDNNDEHDDEKVAMQIEDDGDMDTDMDGDTDDIDIEYMDDLPLFFGWNGDINKLLVEFEDSNIIKQDRKKIVTHTNSMIYDYNKWSDVSLNYPNLNRYEITKLHITKQYCLLNEETRNDFNIQKQEFLSFNNKDEFQSFHEKIDIRGFNNCLVINKNNDDPDNNKPFWCTIRGYWIFSVLLCTVYPRYKCCTMFGKANWKLIKSISV